MAPKEETAPVPFFEEDFRAAKPILFKQLGRGLVAGPDPCHLPVESPLTIDVKDVGAYTVMASPGDSLALAVGFVFSEGLISSRDDIGFLQRCEDDPSVIRLQLTTPPSGDQPARNLIVASSCGMCGAQNLDEMLDALPQVGRTLILDPETVFRAVQAMEKNQVLHKKTGGTHSAALFDAQGRILSQGEDVGRHNALDKAVGKMILAGQETAGYAAALSGRVSLEMALKAIRAGVELIAAVSSPTSLALDAAKRCGLTVCAFVRGTRASVYTFPERVRGIEELAAQQEG